MARATAKDATTPAVAAVAVKAVVPRCQRYDHCRYVRGHCRWCGRARLQSEMQDGIVQLLRQASGSTVTLEQLHLALYGRPNDGGPDLPSIQKMIHVLRKRGVPIVRVSGYAIL
jgi:hypothetical protein